MVHNSLTHPQIAVLLKARFVLFFPRSPPSIPPPSLNLSYILLISRLLYSHACLGSCLSLCLLHSRGVYRLVSSPSRLFPLFVWLRGQVGGEHEWGIPGGRGEVCAGGRAEHGHGRLVEAQRLFASMEGECGWDKKSQGFELGCGSFQGHWTGFSQKINSSIMVNNGRLIHNARYYQ